MTPSEEVEAKATACSSDQEEPKAEMNDEEVEGEVVEEQLSKKERKRRAQTAAWQAKKKVRRAEEKQRRKEKKAVIKAAGLGEKLKRGKPNKMEDSSCKMRLVVDMSMDNLMVERDRRRCIAQLAFCYSANRKEPNPAQFHITGFNGPSRQIFDAIGTYSNWDVNLHMEGLDEVVAKEDIVYLTADSENVLSELDDSKAYIIGGLVDHNAHKGICFETAKEKGWAHGRLPIENFIKMNSRRVLTVNHVFEIMLIYWRTKNWEEAFFTVIPKRKGAEKKEEGGEGGGGEVVDYGEEKEGGDRDVQGGEEVEDGKQYR